MRRNTPLQWVLVAAAIACFAIAYGALQNCIAIDSGYVCVIKCPYANNAALGPLWGQIPDNYHVASTGLLWAARLALLAAFGCLVGQWSLVRRAKANAKAAHATPATSTPDTRRGSSTQPPR